MDKSLLRTMLSFSSEACIVLSRSMVVVAANNAAQKEFTLQSGDDLHASFDLSQSDADSVSRCFGSTSKTRFPIVGANGENVIATGWRIGGPFKADRLIALRMEHSLRIRSEFAEMTTAHRRSVQRAKRALVQNQSLQQQNTLLATQVETDPMTGLLNGPALRTRMEKAIKSDLPFALIYLDMNGLKAVNDTLGHSAGDSAIMMLADALRSNIRKMDAAARLGGDEFAMIAYGITSEDDLLAMGQNIARALSGNRIRSSDGTDLTLSAAMGAARWPADGTSITTIEKLADFAMYASKRSGRQIVIAHQIVDGAELRGLPHHQA